MFAKILPALSQPMARGGPVIIETVPWSVELVLDSLNHRITVPIYKTPNEIITLGLDLSDLIGDRLISSVSRVYSSGSGLAVSVASVDTNTYQAVVFSVSGGRRHSSHVVTVTASIDDGNTHLIRCPVKVMT